MIPSDVVIAVTALSVEHGFYPVMQALETAVIHESLKRNRGTITDAARAMRVKRTTLDSWVRKYGLAESVNELRMQPPPRFSGGTMINNRRRIAPPNAIEERDRIACEMRELRATCGLSRAEVSRRSGVPVCTIAAIEQAERDPRPETLNKIYAVIHPVMRVSSP